MRVITEVELREQYKQAEFTSFRLPAGTRLTPSAQQFLSDRRIAVLTDSEVKSELSGGKSTRGTDSNHGYSVLATGEKLTVKPEHMTHIRGANLVPKNHPIIKFRGKLDTLEALLIGDIVDAECQGYRELAGDLGDLLEYARKIMSAEVKGEPLEPLSYRGLSADEIRDRSHHPGKYYGLSHVLPQPGHGKLMAKLNFLRTQCREVELIAMDAFCGPDGGDRPDIIQSLNRLSSLVYIMMLQLISGHYKMGS